MFLIVLLYLILFLFTRMVFIVFPRSCDILSLYWVSVVIHSFITGYFLPNIPFFPFFGVEESSEIMSRVIVVSSADLTF